MENLNEKAKSKSQQRLFGMVYAYLKGDLDIDKLSPSLAKKIKDMAKGRRRKTGDKRKNTKGISKSDALDFAATKHEGLPQTVEEKLITKFDKFINEQSNFILSEDDEELYNDPWDNISDEKIIEAFKEYGLSCDEKEHPDNQIFYDDKDYKVRVYFTSYALGGEIPNNITSIMNKISKKIGADSWYFWDPMNTVYFVF